MILILFGIPWLCLLSFSFLCRRDDFIGNIFLWSQFIFIGIGILFWDIISPTAIKIFSTYNIGNLSEDIILLTNFVLIFGVGCAYLVYQCLREVIGKKYLVAEFRTLNSNIGARLDVFYILLSLVGIIFIVDRLHLFVIAIDISDASGLVSLMQAREESVSSYFNILIVYNILPAAVYISFISYLKNRKSILLLKFLFLTLISVSCLLLVFQKRPIIVTIGSLAFCYYVYKEVNKCENKKINIYLIFYRLRWYSLALFALLVGFYYISTSHRFEINFIEAIYQSSGAALSRIFGRLSMPALMYVDYFPKISDFYGLSNIGMISKIFNTQLYADTRDVAMYFSNQGNQGSVASSSIIDFYGGFGLMGVVLGGGIIGFILFFLDVARRKIKCRDGYVFFVVTCAIFIYYLSQASLLRALLGYGGIFFYISWWIAFSRFHILK